MHFSLRLPLMAGLVGSILAAPFSLSSNCWGQSAAPKALEKPKGLDAQEDDAEYYELLSLFVDTLDQVERNFAKTVSRRELMEAAIRGMMARLDRHSNYIAPDQLDDFEKDILSQFAGIGIRFQMEEGWPTVISPLVGTPAYRAGLLSGDRIIEVEGDSTRGWTSDQVVRRLKGPVDSEVTMTVFHPHDRRMETVTLKREVIRISTVLGYRRDSNDDSWQFMADDQAKIGYVRVTAFSNRTESELRSAIDKLREDGMKALIIDLRFNPGGMLSSAVEVSDLFLDEGLIVTTDGRNIRRESWHAKDEGTYPDFPLAILVNGYSASASEIVAASLQDHGRGIVVGSRTFGKASVQQIVELELGRSAMKLTTGSYQRPNGKNIDRESSTDEHWGVQPNDGFELKLKDRERVRLWNDLQRRYVSNSRKAQVDEEDDGEDETETEGTETYIDRQFELAIDHLRETLAES